MSERGEENIRRKMPITLLLLSYGVIMTSFLTIVYVRSEYYKHLYQNVLWDSYSLERNTIRKTVERVIARLETNFSLEHPSVLGSDSVAIHTQCIAAV
ncbi:MAG: hypothetical protein ACXACP_10335 [Candidatus Hodarchaeales archaeon]